MQKYGQTDCANVQQEHSIHKLPAFFWHKIEKDHEIHEKAEKVLGPKEKDLDKNGSNFVKLLVLVSSSASRRTGIFKTCDRIPGSDQNIRPKDKDVFQDSSDEIGAQDFTSILMVVNRPKDCHETKEDVLVNKVSGHDSLVRIVASILQLGQHFKRKVGRRGLKNSCKEQKTQEL